MQRLRQNPKKLMDNKVPDLLFFLFLSFSPLGKLSVMHEITGNNHYADLICSSEICLFFIKMLNLNR